MGKFTVMEGISGECHYENSSVGGMWNVFPNEHVLFYKLLKVFPI